MSNTTVWDEFTGPSPDGDYPEPFKFVTPGDNIAGTITMIRVVTFTNPERRVPELYIAVDAVGDQPAVTRSILAGQVQLQRKLAELRPVVGDRIAIKLERIEPRGGGKTLKIFDVAHRSTGGTAPAASPATDPVPVEAPQPVPAGVSASDLL